MKFSINRDVFVKPLQQLSAIVEKRQTIPVLSNVLMEVTGHQVVITGTDMEVELVSQLNLEGEVEEGATTVPVRKLLDICKSLPADSDISISLDNERLLVRSGRGRYNLATLPADDFPSLEETMEGRQFSLPAKDFRHLIDSTAFSMAQQDVRYYLNGMLLCFSSNGVRSVTTDGHRLALCDKQDIDLVIDDEMQVIVPRKGITELSRLMADLETSVDVCVNRNHIRVGLPDMTFTSKLVDGKFPDYDRVIPKQNNVEAVIDKDNLRKSLSRVMVLSNEKYRGVRLSFAKGTLAMQTNNPEQEEALEEISIDFDSTELEIGFNITYLLDILNNVAGTSVIFYLLDSSGSALVQDKDDSSALYVVMPMRL